jgi:hypothetical protein
LNRFANNLVSNLLGNLSKLYGGVAKLSMALLREFVSTPQDYDISLSFVNNYNDISVNVKGWMDEFLGNFVKRGYQQKLGS